MATQVELVEIPGPGIATAIVAAVSVWASVQPTDLPIWFRLVLVGFGGLAILATWRIERLHKGNSSIKPEQKEIDKRPEEGKESARHDILRRNIATREGSTLAFVSLSASASLIVFALAVLVSSARVS